MSLISHLLNSSANWFVGRNTIFINRWWKLVWLLCCIKRTISPSRMEPIIRIKCPIHSLKRDRSDYLLAWTRELFSTFQTQATEQNCVLVTGSGNPWTRVRKFPSVQSLSCAVNAPCLLSGESCAKKTALPLNFQGLRCTSFLPSVFFPSSMRFCHLSSVGGEHGVVEAYLRKSSIGGLIVESINIASTREL